MSQCFGCDLQNVAGLGIEFFRDDHGRLAARCCPSNKHCGLGGIVHGGLVATFGEELAAAEAGAHGNGGLLVTRMAIDYERPTYAGDEMTAVVTNATVDGRKVNASVEIHNATGRVAVLNSAFVLITEDRLRQLAGISVAEAPECMVAGRNSLPPSQ
jgi:acyl-coenzyme A thioesterase PaaI-like protein